MICAIHIIVTWSACMNIWYAMWINDFAVKCTLFLAGCESLSIVTDPIALVLRSQTPGTSYKSRTLLDPLAEVDPSWELLVSLLSSYWIYTSSRKLLSSKCTPSSKTTNILRFLVVGPSRKNDTLQTKQIPSNGKYPSTGKYILK